MNKAILFSLISVFIIITSCQKQVDYSPQIAALNAKVSALQQSRDSLATALAQINTANASVLKSIDSIRTQLNSISTQIASLNSQLNSVNANITSLLNQIALLNQQYLDLLSKLNIIIAQLQVIPNSLNSGLVAYYPFNGNALDNSGFGNDGTVYGATLTVDRFGLSNSAYFFNGNGNYIQTNFEGVLGANRRTVSLWTKSNVLNIAQGGMSAVAWGPFTIAGTRFDAFFNFNAGGVSANIAGSAVTYSPNYRTDDNLWHHYIFMIDTNNPTVRDIKVYQDGLLLSTVLVDYFSNIPINTQGGYPMKIGRTTATGIPAFFNGSIDDVRVYNRALTSSEISFLATH